MSKNTIIMVVSAILLISTTAMGELLFQENFNYTAGTNLTANGWTAHSASGTNAIKVHTSGLTFPAYVSSGIGLAAKVDTTGEDVNRTYTSQTSGTIYCAFMVNVTKAKTLGDYFFHLSTSPLSTAEFICRIHIISNATGNLAFGLGKRHTDTTFTSYAYSLNTTYLVVLKYQFVSGDNNDQLSLFVITNSAPFTEPTTPTIGPITPTSADPANIGSVALRQGQAANAPSEIVDGIRIGTSWSDIIPAGIEENRLVLTSDYSTLQISPNPFTEYVKITYNANPINFKGIKIYDMAGNLVKTYTEPNARWDGRNDANQLVAPGVYFVQVETAHERKIGKVVLSK